ncbi:Phytochrome two-component sensor histidine kinase Cyanobacterial phytochrome B [Paramagnetospirillum magnetotacticum MS-1]|uniref:histidine kinase n=1 Tax=Paramagnetospirillum magnetotacticum MS-1 TaxID=272627 RepID=A0A0C2YV38_PARME|nr:Phytochrome two-component sensor histidine kinase Cyanobacterial phytochrome B [Paramagnetospirillum magnetotacticum MS-1]
MFPALILGVLLLPGVVDAFDTVARQEGLSQARAQQSLLMQAIERRSERTRNIALLPAPLEVLSMAEGATGPTLDQGQAAERLRGVLSRWFRDSADLNVITVLDRQGHERLRFEPREGGGLAVAALSSESRHGLGARFASSMSSGQGGASVLAGGALRLFQPIRKPDGTSVGMLTIDYDLTGTLSAAARSVWVDGSGRPLHGGKDAVTVFDRFPNLKKSAEPKPVVVGGDGGERIAWVPLVVGPDPTDRLWIGTRLDESELDAWLAALWLRSGIVAGVLVLALIVAARWAAIRAEAIRLNALTGLNRIIAGEKGVRFDWSGPKEIRRLGADLTELGARHSAINADLRRFTEILAHHLQEPVRIQVTYVQTLAHLLPKPLSPEIEEVIGFVQVSAVRLRDLLHDAYLYLVVDRLPPPSEPVSAAEALQAAWRALSDRAEQAGAQLDTGSLPAVKVCRERLVDLFMVLLSNAIEFRSPDRPPRITVECADRETMWEFSVGDNGIGIEADYLERIFRVFERLHPRGRHAGTGVGLALARKIVEYAGGSIHARSAPGQGSTFLFTLPKIPGASAP